MSPQITEQQEA